MMALIEHLKTAAEHVEKAAELVREAAKETSLPSEAARQSVREEVARIRLQLMLLGRDLTVLRDTANRRKPRGAEKKVRLD